MKLAAHFRSLRTASAAIVVAFAAGLSATQAQAQGAEAVRAKHESLRQSLAQSPFQRPLVLESSASASDPHGDVYAVVEHPFDKLTAALRQPRAWCDILLLQTNIKRCVPSDDSAKSTLRVAIARKLEQPAEDAFEVVFRYTVREASAGYLALQLAADTGPVGTRDYKLGFEAVPVDATHTFVHLSYSYASGAAARLATNAYLASAGRNKVGFTVVGRDAAGQPIYAGGVQGVAERNTMRYFLAIEACLKAASAPADQQLEMRLREWFTAIERHPRQLHEMERDDYLAMKRRESKRPAAPKA